jgi:acetyltransferase-like isoleucine patch superfamily enzyme
LIAEIKNQGRWLYDLLWRRPRGLGELGAGSYAERPWKIDHPRYIQVGSRSTIKAHAWLSAIPMYAGRRYDPKLTIGSDVYIGHHACITCIDRVDIADGCVLSEQVYIADSFHGIDPRDGPIMKRPLGSNGAVLLGRGTFLGYRASVLSGVTLGEHCIVGAHAVVTRSFPAFTMVAGIPARPIKTYNHERGEWIRVQQL